MHSKLLPDFCFSGRPLDELAGVVVHYFSAVNVDPENAYSLEACRDLFKDLNRPRAEREKYMLEDTWQDGRFYASAHMLVGRDSEVWKLCDYDRQAYHAGASIMHGRKNCNDWTLGIELVGDKTSGFSRPQYRWLAEFIVLLEDDYGMSRDNVAGHDAVRHEARQTGMNSHAKKYDPSGQSDGEGKNFDWFYLGKLMNDIKPNPTGVNTIEDLDATLEADPLSEP